MRLVRIITIRYKYNSSLEIREFLLHGDQATQTNIIRTKSSLWETGSDYLFILRNLRILISAMVLSSVRTPNQEDRERKNDLDYGGLDYEKTD